MIEVKNVVKSFDGFRALDGLTMTVPHGAVYGLVGPNGAGKSTIIRHLAGIYRQDSGDVLVDGQPVYENTAVKRRMAVIGDDWYYFPQSGIREMARFYAGLYPAFSWERYQKLKEVFPLDEKLMLRRMSKGMQKQAAFWLTVCCMPEYLILDEPVDGLDPVMRRQVWSLLLGDVAERGTTVLVSSHNLRELEDVCDHVGILNHGRLLFEGSLQQLQKHSRGGILLDEKGMRHYDCYKVDVKDSNGCGDTFHGAFVAAKIKGMTNDQACKYASAAAAIKCTRLGARYGMANDEECRAFLQERGVTL